MDLSKHVPRAWTLQVAGVSGAASRETRRTAGRGRVTPTWLAWPLIGSLSPGCLLVCVVGCSSATVSPQPDAPRVLTIPGGGEYRWDPQTGWVKPEAGQWGAVESVRREANEAFQAKAYADALQGYQQLQGRLKADDPSLTETHYYIAECYYHLGHYEPAVEHYRKVYREGKPEQAIADTTRQRIYEIAIAYLHGNVACSVFGISYNCPRHGVDLLIGEDGLITEYPYLHFADDALMEIARYYFDSRQYPEAVPMYQRVIRDYQGEWTGTAQFQLALSWYKQIRGTDYDEKVISQAEKEFRQYLDIEPRGAHAGEARDNLHTISEMLAAKYLRIAKFYLRESEPRAARIYLRRVLIRYTDSGAAREAREIQRQLDELALGE